MGRNEYFNMLVKYLLSLTFWKKQLKNVCVKFTILKSLSTYCPVTILKVWVGKMVRAIVPTTS